MATPHVSGVASLLKGYNSALYNDDIEQIIRLSADDLGAPGWDEQFGTGRINARKALELLRTPYELDHLTSSGGNIVSSTWDNYQTFYGLSGYQDGTYIVQRHTVEKTVSFSKEYSTEPHVWGIGIPTIGYSKADPNFTVGFCEVAQGTVTNTNVKLRTYIYDLYIEDPYDHHLDYQGTVPTSASNVVFAYTVLGDPIPAVPANFDGSWQSSHPHLTWSANSEEDFQHYEIWKKKNGVWSLKTTTNNTYYTDTGEFKYTPGHIKTNIYYKIQAVDLADQVSGYTHDELFTVNAPEQSMQELNEYLNISISIPAKYELNQNHPNPFNPITQIRFGLPEAGFTIVKVYDIQGKLIRTLVNSNLEAGYHTYSFSGENLSSGIYIFELKSGTFHQLKRMLLLK